MSLAVETIIIGGGQAGLSLSYLLKQRNHEHIVLEAASKPAFAWREQRWDSFTLITPNWALRLPGAHYDGPDSHGFLPREQILAYFEDYAQKNQLPIQFDSRVTSVVPAGGGSGYRVLVNGLEYHAHNVVVATGLFQQPKIPHIGQSISRRVLQLHAATYRNPEQLPAGAVLVVGSAQSGCQIAEELYQAGRAVYLCLSSAGRVPRRYRGKDIFEWLNMTGVLDTTVDSLPSPRAKFAASSHGTGKDGGHTINLHQFARDGVRLLGRMAEASQEKIRLKPGMHKSLEEADKFEAELVKNLDKFIAASGLASPEELLPQLRDGFWQEEVEELDLAASGIASIIWSTGFSFDFSLVRLPVTDADGYPLQQRGVTEYPGLYFLGMPWLYKQKSGLLVGVGEDAQNLADVIDGRQG